MHHLAKQFVRCFLALTALMVVSTLTLSMATDPFWIWQKDPHWLAANDGKNLNLDRRMRLAKSLQMFTRPTELVIIGSSKVTRGFDVQGNAYNLGIASLRMEEMEGFIHHLLRWKRVHTLIIGLDYAMFDSLNRIEEGYNPAILRPGYAAEAALATLVSRDAVDAVRMAHTRQPPDTGRWHWNGYQETRRFSADECRKMARSIAADHATIRPPDAETYAALERGLAHAVASEVATVIYLAPMHASVRRGMAEAGAWPQVEAWRKRVMEIAARQHVAVYDFTEATPSNDKALLHQGSTRQWHEPSHFTAVTGAWMLKEIGVEKKW